MSLVYIIIYEETQFLAINMTWESDKDTVTDQ